MRRFRGLPKGSPTLAGEVRPLRGLLPWSVVVATLVLALSLVLAGDAQPTEVVLTPLVPGATPPAATPQAGATPLAGYADGSGGVGSRLLGQQAAAQATIAAYATREAVYAVREATQAARIATLEVAVAEVQVTATALVVVAANTVLDPTRQSLTVQTDLEGMLNGDGEAIAQARSALTGLLARYPPDCRAGFMLISGTAPSVEEGVALARRVE